MEETRKNSDPIVTTTHGKIQGKLRQTVYNDDYYCFDGIPYAKPPTKELRFKSPQDIEHWSGILNCTEIKSKCVQYNKYKDIIEGSEDCLYINIYSKNLNPKKPLPVMVYIFGGAFNTSEPFRTTWGPDYFMMKDVVLIMIGYRVGPFGFMSFKDPSLEIPGNVAVRDMILGLKWVNRNCQNFGGDAQNITAFGHSSGSLCIQMLMMCPLAKGLFHKAILMAGFSMYFNQIPNLNYRAAKSIGYEGQNNELELYEFFKNIDALKLVNLKVLTDAEKSQGYLHPYLPTVEPYKCSETIISKQPIEILKNCWGNNIPIMTGVCSMEFVGGYHSYNKPEYFETMKQHPEYLLPLEVQSKCDLNTQLKMAKDVVDIHFEGEEFSTKNVYKMIDLDSFSVIVQVFHRYLHSRMAYSKAPTYLYRFDFDSPTFNLYRIKLAGPDIRGVTHADELSYMFYLPQSFKLDKNSEEFKTIERVMDIWTTYAANSNPNCNSTKSLNWVAMKKTDPRMCLNISNDLSYIKFPETKKLLLWDISFQNAFLPLY